MINTLYSRYGGGRIFIKGGVYYPSKTVTIPDGIKLIIEGEGDATVFKYTGAYRLFWHEPGNATPGAPTWTSVLVFRNFKVDRSGSGSNVTDVLSALYAQFVMFDNITVIDDYTTQPGTAIFGRNNIIVIVQNCRVFNKGDGIFIGGYFVVLRNNYVVNVSKVGIATSGITPNIPTPSSPPPFILSIVEDNVCIDCGEADEALGVDAGASIPVENALGIIRNNIVVTQSRTMNNGIIAFAHSHVIIENNLVMGTVTGKAIIIGAGGGSGDVVIIRNNKVKVTASAPIINSYWSFNKIVVENNDIEATISENTSVLNIGLHKSAVIVNNKFNITYTYSGDISLVFNIDTSSGDVTYVRGNRIVVATQSGYYVGKLMFVYAPVYVEDNYIQVPLTSNYSAVWIGVKASQAEAVVKDNVINAGGGYAIGLGFYVNTTLTLLVRGNRVYGASPSIIYFLASGVTVTLYLDTDPEISISPISGMTVYRFRRNSGVATFSGDGTTTQFKIAHGLAKAPSKIQVTPGSSDAKGGFYVTADSTYIYVNYDTAPPAGTNNIVLYWYAEV